MAVVGGPMYDSLYRTAAETAEIGFDLAFRGDHPALNEHLASLDDVPYDIVSTHTKYAPSQRRFLAPLDGVIGPQELADFVPAVLELARIDGSLYGLPRNIDVRLLHYRTDLIEKPPATWVALLDEARVLNQPPGLHAFVFPGKESGLFGTFFELAEMGGASVFADDLSLDVVNDGGRWALGFLRTLYAENLVPPELLDWHFDEVHRCFRSGRAAMVGDWPGFYEAHRDPAISAVAGRFQVAPYPAGPAGRSLAYGGSHTFALTVRGAENPDARALLLHLAAPELQLTEARAGSVPVRRSVMSRIQEEATSRERERWKTLQTVIESRMLIPPKSPVYPLVEELIWHTVQQAVAGSTPIDEALERMAQQSKAIVRAWDAEHASA